MTRDVAFALGGAERLAYEFALKLDRTRFRSYLCITRAPEPPHAADTQARVAELEAAGVTVLQLDRTSSFAFLPWLHLYRMLRREHIDIVHAHLPRASVPGTIIARVARVPKVISHEHGWSFEGKFMRRLLDRQVLARTSDVMLAVSQWDRDHMLSVERLPADLVRVLPHGIPAPLMRGHDLRRELNLGPDIPMIGAVGRLSPEKGYDDLIHAVSLLRASGRQVRCVIAGIGPEEAALRALVDELRLGDAVTFLGYRDDIPDVVGCLDVALMSSWHEGSPLAVMEYMAVGVPIVATAVGGVSEMLRDGLDALLVSPRDPAAMADSIGRLLDDRRLAIRLGKSAQARQQAEFDLETVLERLQDLYEDLEASAAPASSVSAG